jgi:hypothetical protein
MSGRVITKKMKMDNLVLNYSSRKNSFQKETNLRLLGWWQFSVHSCTAQMGVLNKLFYVTIFSCIFYLGKQRSVLTFSMDCKNRQEQVIFTKLRGIICMYLPTRAARWYIFIPKILVYFMAIWYIIFDVLVCCTKKNLATPAPTLICMLSKVTRWVFVFVVVAKQSRMNTYE